MQNELAGTSRSGHDEILSALRHMNLIATGDPKIIPLSGGVSSNIVRIEDGPRVFCAKSALAKLKVAVDWRAPVRRNQTEAAWMREVRHIVPCAVPAILGEDASRNVFAMEWLDPVVHPVWKILLLNGEVLPDQSGQVGTLIGRIHAATAGRPDIAERFANAEDFEALRLAPYLIATAQAHPAQAAHLISLADRTSSTRLVLIHGDVSPKNILMGPKGPILLDAECATYGDPAFDLAFCLNHLLLKTLHLPAYREAFEESFRALANAYFAEVTWEDSTGLDARTCGLLPALALARIDGKSPVEYLDAGERSRIRDAAIPLVDRPSVELGDFWKRWKEFIA
ncbi:MAG TPA: aminoglycoside phosphotransferase family protein [Ensifer sp.]|nr:aminoglycoside phosphotransferase family protein [Ensifer sp.]